MKGASDALLTYAHNQGYVKYVSVTDLVFLTIPVSHVIQSYTTSSRASDFHLGTNDPVFHS